MLASIVCGLFVFLPFIQRPFVAWLRGPSRAKRVLALLVYFQASFLLPFSVVAFLYASVLRNRSVESLFLAMPWQLRLALFLAALLPAWVIVFRAIVREVMC